MNFLFKFSNTINQVINLKKEKLLELLNQMTIEEKLGQMLQIKADFFELSDISTTGPIKDLNLTHEMIYNVGSILNVAGFDTVKSIQDKYLEKNRNHIPLLFMGDIINGYKTIFPIPLLQGCSWDLELISEIASISAKECGYAGINVNFYPMVDLVLDARWGRVMESISGEDPYLGSLYSKVIVDSYHKNNISCCAKHFIGYGAVQSGKDYSKVDMSLQELKQYYLPSFKSCIESGIEMIMPSFTTLNGIPCTANVWLLKDLLRKELNFNGIIISDYSAIYELIAHGYAKDESDAAFKALDATVDIEMMSSTYIHTLPNIIKTNKALLKKIDDAVFRILSLKNELGLFENPYANLNAEKEKTYILCKENRDIARQIASNTFVLLENKNNILPLSKETKICLIGPYSNNIAISGSWSIYSKNESSTVTLKDGLYNKLNKEFPYENACHILTEEEFYNLEPSAPKPEYNPKENFNKNNLALDLSKQSDVIILAIGEHYKQSGEGASRSNIELPNNQIQLLNSLLPLNKPIICILFSGRPLEISYLAKNVNALLWVGFPGIEGGNAIADVLYGDVNPCGKLILSFPQNSGQCPIYYNHYSTGRPNIVNSRFTSKYIDIPDKPYYPFGYGLSYSNFKYLNLKLDSTLISESSPINASVKIKNESNIPGYEIIQVYIQDLFGSIVRPVKELKSFKKVYFQAYEEKEIKFEITTEMLKFWNDKLEFVYEPGEFKIFIGPNSEYDLLSAKFCLF